MLMTFKSLFLASRPKTLVAGLCPVFLGAAFAFHYVGSINWLYLSVIVLASSFIQIATNFFNDALDTEAGRDSEARLGPDRATARGLLSSSFLKKAACSLLFFSFVLGIVLAVKAGFWILLVGVPALFLAYLYTGTDLSLSTNGAADFFVIVYFGIVPVWVTCLVLSDVSSLPAALSGLQLGLLANALLLINNLRDVDEDRSENKKTLIVRFGRSFGLLFLAFCLFAPYLIFLFQDVLFFRAAWWSLYALLLAFFIFWKVCKNAPSKTYNMYLGLTALHLLVFTILYSVGVLSS